MCSSVVKHLPSWTGAMGSMFSSAKKINHTRHMTCIILTEWIKKKLSQEVTLKLRRNFPSEFIGKAGGKGHESVKCPRWKGENCLELRQHDKGMPVLKLLLFLPISTHFSPEKKIMTRVESKSYTILCGSDCEPNISYLFI